MNEYARYFASLQAEQTILSRHGFDMWPDVEELARYVFEVVDALGVALSIDFSRDVRGRLVVVRLDEGGGDSPWISSR